MSLQSRIDEARERREEKALLSELRRSLIQQFGEEVLDWFGVTFGLNSDNEPEAIFHHRGYTISVSPGDTGTWYVGGNELYPEWEDADDAENALLVALDDLANELDVKKSA